MLRRRLAAASAAFAISACAWGCPRDAEPRAPATLLTVQWPGASEASFGAADLAALPQARLTQSQTVTSAGGSAASERSVSYSGVLLRDLLLKTGGAAATDRGARASFVEVVATDGYRAIFSWGEVFNLGAGDQVLVITAQDGRALDAFAGPLALRSLADIRPGPRHVRNLCAIVVRRP